MTAHNPALTAHGFSWPGYIICTRALLGTGGPVDISSVVL